MANNLNIRSRNLIKRDEIVQEDKENKAMSEMLIKSMKSPVSNLESDFFDKAQLYATKLAENIK